MAKETIQQKAKKLADYTRKLVKAGCFVFHKWGAQSKMSLIIIESCLQGGINFDTVVRPALGRFERSKPKISKVSEFRFRRKADIPLLSQILEWRKSKRACKLQRIADLAGFLSRECIDTKKEFRAWLEEGNSDRLQEIKGIKGKTVEYLKNHAGIDTVAVDIHLRAYLREAGVSFADDKEAGEIIKLAAKRLGKKCADYDHSIWRYRSDKAKGKKKKSRRC